MHQSLKHIEYFNYFPVTFLNIPHKEKMVLTKHTPQPQDNKCS